MLWEPLVAVQFSPPRQIKMKWEWLIEKHCKKLNVYIGNDLVELGLKVNNNHKITVPDKFKQKHKLK